MHSLQKAFVLHVRPYSDSRVLIEWFTCDLGRLACIGRMPSKRNRSEYQLFQGHLIQLKGKGELKTLTQVESLPAERYVLNGEAIKCGFYINELLIRVLPKEVCESGIFNAYQKCLAELVSGNNDSPVNQVALRNFELDCITDLGYGIDFHVDANEGKSIMDEQYYQLSLDQGFIKVSTPINPSAEFYTGATINAIGRRQFDSIEILRAAKRICRVLLAPLLGDRPLKSRELFR